MLGSRNLELVDINGNPVPPSTFVKKENHRRWVALINNEEVEVFTRNAFHKLQQQKQQEESNQYFYKDGTPVLPPLNMQVIKDPGKKYNKYFIKGTNTQVRTLKQLEMAQYCEKNLQKPKPKKKALEVHCDYDESNKFPYAKDTTWVFEDDKTPVPENLVSQKFDRGLYHFTQDQNGEIKKIIQIRSLKKREKRAAMKLSHNSTEVPPPFLEKGNKDFIKTPYGNIPSLPMLQVLNEPDLNLWNVPPTESVFPICQPFQEEFKATYNEKDLLNPPQVTENPSYEASQCLDSHSEYKKMIYDESNKFPYASTTWVFENDKTLVPENLVSQRFDKGLYHFTQDQNGEIKKIIQIRSLKKRKNRAAMELSHNSTEVPPPFLEKGNKDFIKTPYGNIPSLPMLQALNETDLNLWNVPPIESVFPICQPFQEEFKATYNKKDLLPLQITENPSYEALEWLNLHGEQGKKPKKMIRDKSNKLPYAKTTWVFEDDKTPVPENLLSKMFVKANQGRHHFIQDQNGTRKIVTVKSLEEREYDAVLVFLYNGKKVPLSLLKDVLEKENKKFIVTPTGENIEVVTASRYRMLKHLKKRSQLKTNSIHSPAALLTPEGEYKLESSSGQEISMFPISGLSSASDIQAQTHNPPLQDDREDKDDLDYNPFKYINDDNDEPTLLFSPMHIGETSFFRDEQKNEEQQDWVNSFLNLSPQKSTYLNLSPQKSTYLNLSPQKSTYTSFSLFSQSPQQVEKEQLDKDGSINTFDFGTCSK